MLAITCTSAYLSAHLSTWYHTFPSSLAPPPSCPCWLLPKPIIGSTHQTTMLCPWARHFTPRKYWLITQEAMAPSRYDWKIVDWDVKPQHNQPTKIWLPGTIPFPLFFHGRHILSWRLGHENISTAILPLPLIQEEQLSVTGERMCTKYW